MIKLYVELSEKSIIAQTLVHIADTYGCIIIEDVEDASHVVCLSATTALSLMKQTDVVIDIFVLPLLTESDNVAIKALVTRFPDRINVLHMFADDGSEGFPLLLNSWIGGDK